MTVFIISNSKKNVCEITTKSRTRLNFFNEDEKKILKRRSRSNKIQLLANIKLFFNITVSQRKKLCFFRKNKEIFENLFPLDFSRNTVNTDFDHINQINFNFLVCLEFIISIKLKKLKCFCLEFRLCPLFPKGYQKLHQFHHQNFVQIPRASLLLPIVVYHVIFLNFLKQTLLIKRLRYLLFPGSVKDERISFFYFLNLQKLNRFSLYSQNLQFFLCLVNR